MTQMSLFEEEDESLVKAREYFDRNPRFLDALLSAARVMERIHGKVSARFLIEFARWLRFLDWDGMRALLECFRGVVVVGEDMAAIPNAYSAYLTRYLESRGVSVTKAKSRMDGGNV